MPKFTIIDESEVPQPGKAAAALGRNGRSYKTLGNGKIVPAASEEVREWCAIAMAAEMRLRALPMPSIKWSAKRSKRRNAGWARVTSEIYHAWNGRKSIGESEGVIRYYVWDSAGKYPLSYDSFSSGTYLGLDSSITIVPGWSELDIKLVFLHELAHHIARLTGKENHKESKDGHSVGFWTIAIRLYWRYGISNSYIYAREASYRSTNFKAAWQAETTSQPSVTQCSWALEQELALDTLDG